MNEQALVSTAFSQLLDTIDNLLPALARALALSAIPPTFDVELLAALRAEDDGLEAQILQRMVSFSFVHSRNGHYHLSPEARRQIMARWRDDLPGYRAANQRAMACYDDRLARLEGDEFAPDESLVMGRLFHLLAVREEEGIVLLYEIFRQAQDDYRPGFAEQQFRVAYEQRPFLSPAGQMHLDHLQGLVRQYHGDWQESAAVSKYLLAAEGLPRELAPHVRRSLARALVAQEQWDAGLAEYEEALAGFQELGDDSEMGRTMGELGRTHLDLALGLWGSDWLRQPPAHTLGQLLADLLHTLARLPLVIYLLYQLGPGTMLPVVHRLVPDLDWIEGRLLGTAGSWLRRAVKVLSRADDPAGKIAAREDLAQLYRLLNHPRQAAEINASILEEPAIDPAGYRAARAKLGLAYARLQMGQTGEPERLLHEALPVFRAYSHRERIAQTQTLLARAELQAGDADEATWYYLDALDTWQSEHNLAAATDVLYEMEAVQRRNDLSLEAREELAHAARRATRREYRIRYSHPALTVFHQVSLLLFVALLFFGLRLAIRTRSGVLVGTAAPLVQPVHGLRPGEPLPAGIADTEKWTPPPNLLLIRDQLEPTLQVRFLGPVTGPAIGGAVFLYFTAYTLVGLGLIFLLPLGNIQANRMQALQIDTDGMVDLPHQSTRLGWAQITALYLSDRIVYRRPLRQVSFFAVLGGSLPLEVSALARHYQALQEQVRRNLPSGVPVHDLGFRLWRTRSGWLFLASLAFLLLFTLLASLNPAFLTAYPLPIPYNLSDLYGIAYLFVALCLGWWFAVQPLRVRFAIRPTTRFGWFVGAGGLILGLLHLLQFSRWRFPLVRPDLSLGVLSVLCVYQAAVHIYHARPRGVDGQGNYVYARPVRWAVLLVAALSIALVSVTMSLEIASFHHLARGNYERHQAERYLQMSQSQASEQPTLAALELCDQPAIWLPEIETLYSAALRSYDVSRSLHPEPAIDNNRGVLLALMGQYEPALTAYAQTRATAAPFAFIGAADHLIFGNNRARAYEEWAVSSQDPLSRVERYLQAIAIRNSQLSQRDSPTGTVLGHRRSRNCNQQTKTALLHLGTAYYNLGQAYQDLGPDVLGKRDSARSSYERAGETYERVLRECAQEPTTYAALGWSHIRLARLAEKNETRRDGLSVALNQFETALANRDQQAFIRATDRFEQARHSSRGASTSEIEEYEGAIGEKLKDLPALMGRGWANYFIAVTYPGCIEEMANRQDAEPFEEHIEAAITAFQDTILVHDAAASAYEQVGEGYRQKGEVDQAQEAEQKAQSLRTESAVHHRTSAQLHYALRRCTSDGQLNLGRHELALGEYDRALALDPCHAQWHMRGGNLHWALAEEHERASNTDAAHEHWLAAVNGYQAMLALRPTIDKGWITLGEAAHRGAWERRAVGDREAAAELERLAVAAFTEASMQPDRRKHRALWEQARSLYWLGDYDSAVEISSLAEGTTPFRKREIPLPSFYRGLVHAVEGEFEAAIRRFLLHIPILDSIGNEGNRHRIYNTMLHDLGAASDIDPAAVAFFIQVLEQAKLGELQQMECQTTGLVPEALVLRSGPGDDYPAVHTVEQGEALFPLARNREGTWLYVYQGKADALGWLPAAPDITTCDLPENVLPDLMLPAP